MQVKYLFLLSRDPPTCSAAPALGFKFAVFKNNSATLIQIITPERHSLSSGGKHIRLNYATPLPSLSSTFGCKRPPIK